MKLEKAIENLKQEVLIRPLPHEQNLNDAHKLGIEALKWVLLEREQIHEPIFNELPGETKD